MYMQGFIQPPKVESTLPSPAELPPPQANPKNFDVPEVYKMTKVIEDRRENGLKINLPLKFLYLNFKIF